MFTICLKFVFPRADSIIGNYVINPCGWGRGLAETGARDRLADGRASCPASLGVRRVVGGCGLLVRAVMQSGRGLEKVEIRAAVHAPEFLVCED